MPDRLAAVGARWDGSPAAGDWVAARLGPFGPSVGHAVPHGYAAYAVVPVPRPDDDAGGDPRSGRCCAATTPLSVLLDVLSVLARWTGNQDVHCALWEGWGFLHDPDEDPLAGSMAVFGWASDGTPFNTETPTSTPLAASARAEALTELRSRRVPRPAAPPLELPGRRYHLWTGPWRSAGALAHEHASPPSLVWPDDRAWFVGAPVYTEEIAVGGSAEIVRALLADPALRALGARAATVDDVLRIDD
ncbi:hypothetical protein [Xylanimonas protaetiae]|uniref:Uncharacterized protein n=1 Tax=Xylanimonas protaetiae TaxID=2509457 RepID=A0A4P6F1P2_9MICO|nr:hypothetical protein [Xylanimonas protaetiae]QAY69045.1 hypothetical protein ET471_02450 [Xylanimonas protaetiae]